jgi:hypothetical protein
MTGMTKLQESRGTFTMTDVAHKPDCKCAACSAARPEGYVAPTEHDWHEDAKEAGKLHNATQAGLWRTAFLIARSVEPGTAGRPKKNLGDSEIKSGRVSFAAFAKVAGPGLSDKTVAKYYATWQAAAVKGIVPEASTIGPTRKIKALDSLTVDQWDEFKPKAVQSTPVSANAKAASNKSAANSRSPGEGMGGATGARTGSREPVSGTVLPRGTVADFGDLVEQSGAVSTDPAIMQALKVATATAVRVRDILKGGVEFNDTITKAMTDYLVTVNEVRDLSREAVEK